MVTEKTGHAVGWLDCSVVVCTYNRSRSLARTLECLGQQLLPPGLFIEIIVVDNNSSDDTRGVVRRFEQCSSAEARVHYAFEPRQGLSNARNAGIALARGDIVLFTDDDVCPARDWVAQVREGMRRYQAMACGGYIAPAWEVKPPVWLTSRFHGFLAVRMDEEGPKPVGPGMDPPYGANMAFRREVFDQVGLFDAARGRRGSVLASGEDGDLFVRIIEKGLPVVYLPQARVTHRIEAFRLRKPYFRRWRFQNSRNIAVTKGVPGARRVFGVPPYLIMQLGRAILRAGSARFRSPPDEAFFREVLVWHFLGLIAGLFRWRRPFRPAGMAANTGARD